MAINEPRILVVGCGALGSRIASDLSHDSQVFGLKRNIKTLPANVGPVKADLQDPASLAGTLPENLDAVIYCLTPNSYDDAGYEAAFVTGLGHLMGALQTANQSLKRLLFVSSTGVYQQDDDSWVDESSPTEPHRFSGRRLLEGEQLALRGPWPATVIRYSGIYGSTRRRFLQSVLDGKIAPPSPGPYTNRIHEEDAAAAAAHLIRRALAGQPLENCYLGSDSAPVRIDAIVEWIRHQVHCERPDEDARSQRRAGSKRCSNQRLRDSGFKFRYPGYKEGYGALIEAL
ncbi:sugar nucleotide-binding protein [Marinobacter fonticola]|uniref:sugar nucleotide-binding protein n=1 Tax=Marinobacter fonticola TaxID=2603215 RepID=UPI0011E7A042|nr:sugar nucleotide-binding protein [Marinobacter fonticola]